MTEIAPNTTMEEILNAYPSARLELFRRYHVGGCQACGYQVSDTLDQVRREVWQAARAAVFTPAQQASPLARRPSDLRHAAVPLWLNSGVPATEVARRAGHGVAVLLNHNVWAADWRVLITLFGWLAAIGGAQRIIWPQATEAALRWFLTNPTSLVVAGIIWLVIGALLCFYGYRREPVTGAPR